MSSLWDAMFIQVLDHTGPLILNLSGTPYTTSDLLDVHGSHGYTKEDYAFLFINL
jgi:hypothetical protein